MKNSNVLVIIDESPYQHDAWRRSWNALEPFKMHNDASPYPVRKVSHADLRAALNQPLMTDEEAETILSFPDLDIESVLDGCFSEPIDFISGRYMEMSRQNPKGKWKSYELGGQWKNIFCVKGHSSGDHTVQKHELELDLMLRKAELDAEEEYLLFLETVAKLAPLRPGPSLAELLKVYPSTSQGKLLCQPNDSAYSIYNKDPWRNAVRKAMSITVGDPVDIFFYENGGQDAYIRHAINKSLDIHAVLDTDGEWWDRSDFEDTPEADEEWHDMLMRLIEQSDDNDWFMVYKITK